MEKDILIGGPGWASGKEPGVGEPLWHEPVHGWDEFQVPQLEMARRDLEGIPELTLPAGYRLRPYQPGDEEAWGEIMTEAFTPYWNATRFRRLLLPHFGFKPERVIMLCRQDTPVGSASAFQWPGIPKDRGYIHMLGVKKEHCGLKLGFSLCVACLRRFKQEGFRSAMLQTEDYRIPAIKHYLRLGFKPVLVNEDQRAKWAQVLERIGDPEWVQALNLPELPVMGKFAFWWRTTLTVNYFNWLSLKGELRGT